MLALRVSADVADIRFQKNIQYEYAKVKTRGQLRTRTRYTPFAPADVSSGKAMTNSLPALTTIGEKQYRPRKTLAAMFKKNQGK